LLFSGQHCRHHRRQQEDHHHQKQVYCQQEEQQEKEREETEEEGGDSVLVTMGLAEVVTRIQVQAVASISRTLFRRCHLQCLKQDILLQCWEEKKGKGERKGLLLSSLLAARDRDSDR
jgi:hypothetical protein